MDKYKNKYNKETGDVIKSTVGFIHMPPQQDGHQV